MTTLLLLLLPLQAANPDALLEQAAKAPDARKVIDSVVRLKVIKDPLSAAKWLEELSRRRKGDAYAMRSAGYLYLVANKPADAVRALKAAIKISPTGLAWSYLADAYRRLGKETEGAHAVVEALRHPGTPRASTSRTSPSRWPSACARRNERAYLTLLMAVGLHLRAATWGSED